MDCKEFLEKLKSEGKKGGIAIKEAVEYLFGKPDIVEGVGEVTFVRKKEEKEIDMLVGRIKVHVKSTIFVRMYEEPVVRLSVVVTGNEVTGQWMKWFDVETKSGSSVSDGVRFWRVVIKEFFRIKKEIDNESFWEKLEKEAIEDFRKSLVRKEAVSGLEDFVEFTYKGSKIVNINISKLGVFEDELYSYLAGNRRIKILLLELKKEFEKIKLFKKI